MDRLIQLHADAPGGLMPEALELLAGGFRGSLYHSQLGLRHPHGAYNVSIYPLLDAFMAVFEEIYSINLKRPFARADRAVWDFDLLQAQLSLLRSLEEHFEVCDTILQGFFPPGTRVGKHAAVKDYRKAVRPHRDRVSKIVNLVKHSQGTLAGFHLFDEERAYLGYYAQDVDEQGYLGPADHIHEGGNTAFSFDRDLRLNLAAVYFASRHLASAIRAVAGEEAGPPNVKGDVVDKPKSVASSIAALPSVVFKDEVTLPFPTVRVHKTEDGVDCLTLRYPDPEFTPTTPSVPMRTVSFQYTDGVTFKWRNPYHPPTDLTKGSA